MPEALRLRLWGPGGEAHEMVLPADAPIGPALKSWARAIGCGAGAIDYQVNDGIRILGEVTARVQHIDVCGLPGQK